MDKLAELRGLDATRLDASGSQDPPSRVDVARRAEVVARDEPTGLVAQALVGDVAPVGAAETSGWPRPPS